MATNAFLIQYANGWHEVKDATSISAYGRREAMLRLGAFQAIREVENVAAQHFASFGHHRTQATATQDPLTVGEAPYLNANFVPGGTVTEPGITGTPTAQRILSITVTEDDDGNLTFVEDLGDLLLDADERFDLTVKKMTDGTLGGHSPQASPPAPS